MSYREVVVPVLMVGLLLSACRREPPPPPEPEPAPPVEAPAEDPDAAERERLERERREREAREAAIRDARRILEQMVFFEYDRSRITPDAEGVLRQKVDILRASPNVRMRLEGHADERGSTEYNLALGNRRSESVRQFLSGFGLDGARFTTVSFGEERPLVRRSDEEAWAQNRRVEFVITAGGDQINPPTAGR